MTTVLGDGRFRYEVKADWGKLPEGWELNDVAAVAVDKQDRVHVFKRHSLLPGLLTERRPADAGRYRPRAAAAESEPPIYDACAVRAG